MKVGGIIVETLSYKADLQQQHSAVTRANRTLPRKGHSRGLMATYVEEEINGRDVEEKRVDQR